MIEPKYHVGQTLIRRDVNEGRQGGPQQVTVTRVGRKLVYVEHHRREEAYRIEDGVRNDKWEHAWLQTPEEYAESNRRSAIETRLLDDHRMTGWPTYVGTDTLEQIADMLDRDKEQR